MNNFLDKLRDPYESKARLLPALLVLLPVALFFVCTLGAKHPLLASVTTVLTACGGPYALANIARTWGQRAQERLYKKWGGKPSTIILRHSDTRLARPTKEFYHGLIKAKFGLDVPTAEFETLNPAQADEIYHAATDSLIRATRDTKKFPLVFKELTSYGFNRNAYGIRWLGVASSILIAFAMLTQGHVFKILEGHINLADFELLNIGQIFVLVFSVLMLLVWLFHFTASTVKLSGFSYSERLCEALDALPRPSGNSKSSKAKPAPRNLNEETVRDSKG